MTDTQVTEFVFKEQEKGTSQSEIVTKLIERGVPIEQIKRIRNKYEREQGKGQVGGRDLTGINKGQERMRRRNGEVKEDEKQMGQRQRRRMVDDYPAASLTDRQRKLRKDRKVDEYTDETLFLFPDSLALYGEYGDDGENMNPAKQVFGRNIFRQKGLSFEPEMNIATPADYRLGVGDAVFIDVWGASQKSITATVTPEGTIDIEGYGQ